MGKLRHVFQVKILINPETKEKEEIHEEYVVCDVCGCANPVLNHKCKECSNLLED